MHSRGCPMTAAVLRSIVHLNSMKLDARICDGNFNSVL